eukprot:COSAG01_NODE_9656_length_2378_cov_6.240456_1_plen_125_part_00
MRIALTKFETYREFVIAAVSQVAPFFYKDGSTISSSSLEKTFGDWKKPIYRHKGKGDKATTKLIGYEPARYPIKLVSPLKYAPAELRADRHVVLAAVAATVAALAVGRGRDKASYADAINEMMK